MSDLESIKNDAMIDARAEMEAFNIASEESALEQCIYLFVEGESEEIAFRILLEEGLGIDFEKEGIVIANYNGIGNLGHTIRLMLKTLSHSKPMVFTFDDDDKKLVSKLGGVPQNVYMFKIPYKPVVTFPNGESGGSFEESFLPEDFVNACFETTLLRENSHIEKQNFIKYFDSKKPFYKQIVIYLKERGLTNYLPNKIEIAEELACNVNPVPDTYFRLEKLIREIRKQHPIQIKI